jgi:hypothetical protein
LLGEAAVKLINLAGTTYDIEKEMLVLKMYLKTYLKVFEKVIYFRKDFKYKYQILHKRKNTNTWRKNTFKYNCDVHGLVKLSIMIQSRLLTFFL